MRECTRSSSDCMSVCVTVVGHPRVLPSPRRAHRSPDRRAARRSARRSRPESAADAELVKIFAVGPLTARPAISGQTATSGTARARSAARSPGTARIGSMLRHGFEGQMTIARRQALRAPRRSGGGPGLRGAREVDRAHLGLRATASRSSPGNRARDRSCGRACVPRRRSSAAAARRRQTGDGRRP